MGCFPHTLPFSEAQHFFHLLAKHACAGLCPGKHGENDRSSGRGKRDLRVTPYYNNSYWFFRGNGLAGTNDLSRVAFDYTGGTPSFQSLATFTISDPTLTDNSFGDIAIKPDGTLYAYNHATAGRFYSLDLTTASSGTVGGFNLISTTSGTGLQLSFNPDYSLLYGHDYDTGKWYEVNTSSGALVEVAGFTSLPDNNKGFRDLGGATIAAVPEPSTLMLASIGAGATFWTASSRRRRRRRRQLPEQDQPFDMANA